MTKNKLFLLIFYQLCCLIKLSAHNEHFLSYIIPAYNCEAYISEAIASIYQQHINIPFEIVCTDDGSSDHTLELLTSLAQAHPELRIYQHSLNRGGGAARNTCVANSRGDIIFCLDADNVLAPDSIHHLIAEFNKGECDIVCFENAKCFIGAFQVVRETRYEMPNQTFSFKDIFLPEINFPGYSGNYLYSRQSFLAAGGYEESYGSLDTFTFGFKQLLKGFKMKYVPGTMYYHRVGIDSYYIRDMNNNRFNKYFCEFLIKYNWVFNDRIRRLLYVSFDNMNKNNRNTLNLLDVIKGMDVLKESYRY